MRRLLIIFATGAWSLAATSVASAQAVQLPTFRYFSVDTTVSVPDRGSAYMGGVNRASSGSTSSGFGPLRNRASGSSVGAAGVSVHATIIDHEELDREVLAEAARRRGGTAVSSAGQYVLRDPHEPRTLSPEQQRIANKSAQLARGVDERGSDTRGEEPQSQPRESRPSSAEPVLSLSALRQQAQADDLRLEQEAAEKLAAGIAAEAAGKLASARGHYEAILRMNATNVREEAASRLAKIALPKKKTGVSPR